MSDRVRGPSEHPQSSEASCPGLLGLGKSCENCREAGEGDEGSFPELEVARMGESKADRGGEGEVGAEGGEEEEGGGRESLPLCPQLPACLPSSLLHRHLLKDHANRAHLKIICALHPCDC